MEENELDFFFYLNFRLLLLLKNPGEQVLLTAFLLLSSSRVEMCVLEQTHTFTHTHTYGNKRVSHTFQMSWKNHSRNVSDKRIHCISCDRCVQPQAQGPILARRQLPWVYHHGYMTVPSCCTNNC